MRYALWFCRAKDYICSPPIRTPLIRDCILQCISKPAACILNCTLTTQTAFQNPLFVFFISFLHLKLETNYGTQNHLFTLIFQFYSLYSRSSFAFQKPHTFCVPKTPLCIHKLGFNIPKFKTDFLLLKKGHFVKLQFYISNSKSNTVF